MRVGLGEGLIITVLISAVAYLLGIVTSREAVSLFFLLSGSWLVIFGFAFEEKSAMLYAGWGLIIAVLSAFIILPFPFTIALVFIALIGIIVISIANRNRIAKRI